MAGLRVGDEVTILPPWDNDPYIVTFQHYGRVAQLTAAGIVVELENTLPPRRQVGPFPTKRLAPGWKDANGRWLVG